MLTDWLLYLHAFSTTLMTGLVWFVQVVQYPLMLDVGEREFVAYENRHTQRTTYIVAPLMLMELVTAIWLTVALWDTAMIWPLFIGFGLLVVVWISTFMLQVPCHRKLTDGCDERVIRRLVRTNWLRTAAWTLRSLLALWLLGHGA